MNQTNIRLSFMTKKTGPISRIYENLFHPILRNDSGLDAEYLTNISLNLIAFSSRNREWPLIAKLYENIQEEFCIKDSRLTQQICGIEFTNPIGLAAGFDKNGIGAKVWKDFGFGFSEIGTVTKFPQEGNPKPRLFRLAKEQAALNRMGFNNNGAKNLEKNLIRQNIQFKERRENLCLGINFGKSKITPLIDSTEDYISSLKLLIPYCNYAAINVSSPNTIGLRKLQSPELLRDLLKEIKKIKDCPPLFIKIAPDLNFKEIDGICQIISDERIDGIIASNTSLDRLGLENRIIEKTGSSLSQEKGGLSGKPLQRKANEIIRYIHNIDKKIILIGVGGIDSPESAWERICSGASLIQIYTGWIYRGPQLVPEILKGFINQIKIHNLRNIQDAIGSELKWQK